MDSSDTLKVSKIDEESLHDLSDLLHLFHHRNRNQHRRSIWWRHFQIFRKQFNSIAAEFKDLNDVPTAHLARTKKKVKDQQTLRRVEQRLRFWQDVMVPKWQHAYSQLTADGRFSVLGLVLMSALAEACRILAITAAFEDVGQAEVEKVLERFAKEGWEREDAVDVENVGEDVGEAISRDPITDGVDEIPSITKAQPVKATTSSPRTELSVATSSKKRSTSGIDKGTKKKRRKGNAIDDLFSGLG